MWDRNQIQTENVAVHMCPPVGYVTKHHSNDEHTIRSCFLARRRSSQEIFSPCKAEEANRLMSLSQVSETWMTPDEENVTPTNIGAEDVDQDTQLQDNKLYGPEESPREKELEDHIGKEDKRKLLHVNVRCLRNKISLIESSISNFDVSFLCITEHWLLDNECEYINIEGFSLASAYCRKKHVHGGSMIFCSKNVNYKASQALNALSLDKHCELSVIETKDGILKHFLICLYRSPSGDSKIFIATMTKLLDQITNKQVNITICGDFNIDFNSPGPLSKETLDLFHSYGLSRTINDATRVTNTSSSCIDNIFTNIVNISSIENVDLNIADHHAQIIAWNVLKPSDATMKPDPPKRLFSAKNCETFTLLMSQVNWNSVLVLTEVNEMFAEFMLIFNSLFNQAFPMVNQNSSSENQKKKGKLRWYTPQLRRLRDEVRSAHLYSKQSDQGKILQRNLKKKYIIELDIAKRKYNDRQIRNAQNKSKTAWAIINSNINCNDKKDVQILLNNKPLGPQDAAENFNMYFSTAVNDLGLTKTIGNGTCPHRLNAGTHTGNNKIIFLRPMMAKEFFEILDKVGNKTTRGIDDIPGKALKAAGFYIIEPLLHIINTSLEMGIFPNALKLAKVVPVFKKSDPHLITNYRPISILSSFSRFFETAMKTRIENFLIENDILNNCQHGFVKGKSTITAITDLVNNIVEARDKGIAAVGIFYDFSMAFDTISHSRLLEKLAGMGIAGIANKWIASFLSGRKQVVQLTHKRQTYQSQEKTVNIGIPQGSVISPLLFILYTNDLPSHFENGSLTLFADDTTHFISASDQNQLVDFSNKATSDMVNWSQKNDLFINKSKTVFVDYSGGRHAREASAYIKLHGKSIARCSDTKFLGIQLSDGSDWSLHIEKVARKLESLCFLIKRIINIANVETAKIVYFAHMHSRLSYGVSIWGSHPKAIHLFRLQKRALRYMAKASYNPVAPIFFKDSCKPLFKCFNILTLPSLYIYYVILYVVENNLHIVSSNHSHDTRSKKVPKPKKHVHSFYKRTPAYAGLQLYSHLPDDLKANKRNFKPSLKKYLMDKCFYSVHEFILA